MWSGDGGGDDGDDDDGCGAVMVVVMIVMMMIVAMTVMIILHSGQLTTVQTECGFISIPIFLDELDIVLLKRSFHPLNAADALDFSNGLQNVGIKTSVH